MLYNNSFLKYLNVFLGHLLINTLRKDNHGVILPVLSRACLMYSYTKNLYAKEKRDMTLMILTVSRGCTNDLIRRVVVNLILYNFDFLDVPNINVAYININLGRNKNVLCIHRYPLFFKNTYSSTVQYVDRLFLSSCHAFLVTTLVYDTFIANLCPYFINKSILMRAKVSLKVSLLVEKVVMSNLSSIQSICSHIIDPKHEIESIRAFTSVSFS